MNYASCQTFHSGKEQVALAVNHLASMIERPKPLGVRPLSNTPVNEPLTQQEMSTEPTCIKSMAEIEEWLKKKQ